MWEGGAQEPCPGTLSSGNLLFGGPALFRWLGFLKTFSSLGGAGGSCGALWNKGVSSSAPWGPV